MKTSLTTVLAIALTSLTIRDASAISPLVGGGGIVEKVTDALDDLIENQCIVRLNDNVDESTVIGIAEILEQDQADASILYVYNTALNGFVVTLPCPLARAALEHLNVEGIEDFVPDRMVVINRLLGRWLRRGKKGGNARTGKRGGKRGGTTSTSPNLQGTPRPNIVRVGGPRDGTGKTAWVVDTGIHLTHPNLYVDTTKGFTAFRNGPDASLHDHNGHGTHVAGTIGATPIRGNIVSVAPGARVVPIKVMRGDGTGTVSSILAGIDHVAKNAGAGDCVNLSLSTGASRILDDAVVRSAARTGAYHVVAAGNYDSDTSRFSPARVNASNVFTISAIDSRDQLATFSNFGKSVDFAAPGVNVLSTWKDGGTSIQSGTSMAAPAACAVIMMTNGKPSSDGVARDKDKFPDKIIHF